ncbi:cytochrome c oxidase subunit 4 isoform 1, mitochondrial-like [Lycorma delicatula]|uniref:cytochrome c oxidase subunit 4 isoform 1, mitochondrial-like n=1 Tax=Lycorma delicatula TaxID=130591 RepID=UPI003F517071
MTIKSRLCQPSYNLLVNSVRHTYPIGSWEKIIGDREIVGHGINGDPTYFDCVMTPCPAIRFQSNSPYIQALREKEKCDWRNLTIEEKKCLYRASFCQTYAEMTAPSGELKSIIGVVLILVSFAVWLFILIKTFVSNPYPPQIFDYECIRARVKRMIDAEIGHLNGISSKWDYENETWKKGFDIPYYRGKAEED